MTADTNLLVRIVVQDDAAQARIAYDLVTKAEQVAVSLPCLCEVAWVLESVYGFTARELSIAIRSIIDPGNLLVDRVSAETGLSILAAGGDFADGVIAAAGTAMGGEVFVSFDRKAVTRLRKIGISAAHAGESV